MFIHTTVAVTVVQVTGSSLQKLNKTHFRTRFYKKNMATPAAEGKDGGPGSGPARLSAEQILSLPIIDPPSLEQTPAVSFDTLVARISTSASAEDMVNVLTAIEASMRIPSLGERRKADVTAAAKAKKSADPSCWGPEVAIKFRGVLQSFGTGIAAVPALAAGALVTINKPKVGVPRVCVVLGIQELGGDKIDLSRSRSCLVEVQMLCDDKVSIPLHLTRRVCGSKKAVEIADAACNHKDYATVLALAREDPCGRATQHVAMICLSNLSRCVQPHECVQYECIQSGLRVEGWWCTVTCVGARSVVSS